MYETAYNSVPYDPEGFKKPIRSVEPSPEDPLVCTLGNSLKQSAVPPEYSSEEDATVREKRWLLDEAKRVRVRERHKTWLWLIVWTGVFGLAMAGVVYYATRRNVPAAVSEVLDKSANKMAARWDPKLGEKACHSIDDKFLLFKQSVTGENISSWSLRTPSVFFFQDDSDWTFEQACSIESFASLLAELVVYALHLQCAKTPTDRPSNNLKKVLAEEYRNLVPLTVDGRSFFRGSPLAGLFQCRRSSHRAMLISGWRFGGLAVIPDVALLSRKFINFPANQVHVTRHFVVSYLRCAPTLFYLMRRLAASGKHVVDVQDAGKEEFDALCCAGICPDVRTEDRTLICDEGCPLLMIKNISEVSQHCPRTWKEFGQSFRVSHPPH